MDRLWSPWRLAYVTGGSTASPDCIFCAASTARSLPEGAPADDLVLVRGRVCYVILNLYPYNNGHLMVVPYRHLGSLAAATADELSELMRLTRDAEIALNEAYQPQGINVGINLGRAAGAGIPRSHAHPSGAEVERRHQLHVAWSATHASCPRISRESARRLRPIFERLLNDDQRGDL